LLFILKRYLHFFLFYTFHHIHTTGICFQERDEFGSYLLNFPLPNRITNEILSETVDLWRTRQITNMEYLSILNKMAARSYNDLMQYPVMPFVLASYNTMELDLNQLSIYR